MGGVETAHYMEIIKQPTQHGVNPYPPEAELRLYSGVPWDNTYQHCRLYSSKTALLSALEKWRVKPSDQLRSMTPIRIGSHQIKVPFTEVKDFAECGLCGTAAVISPVGKIVDHGNEICFPSGMEKMGPVIQKLYDTLTGIQMGHIEAPEGWIHVIK